MMPGAGLYLPDTLSKPLDRTEEHPIRQRYMNRKSSQDSASDRKSIAFSRMSSGNVAKVFSSLPTVFDFADWLSTQGRVSSDNEVFIDLLQRVRHDVTEASRLYTSQAVIDYLESWPDKKVYIDKIIHDIEKVLNDIGQFLENVQVSGDDGSTTSLRRKFQWAISHQKKLRSKQQLLTTCHQSLMPAVQLMQTAEMNATFDPIHELPERPWVEVTASDILKSPRSRQKSRFNQRNSSVPSITLSEPDLKGDKFVRPRQHVLAELPGSTPDDLQRLSMDVHVDSPKARSKSMEEVIPTLTSQSGTHSPSKSDLFQERRRPTTADAHIAAAPRQRPPDSPPSTRKSADQVRPSLSFFDDRARASFDSARPRAYSEQMRPQRSFEMRSRPSHDQVRPMPTLTERPIERFNSTASVAVGDAISVPLTSMRYQTRHVDVRKPPVKHNSLPSSLPSFTSQTSLMDDLSTWVIPPSAHESYRSVLGLDAATLIDDTTPATLVSSSSNIPDPPASFPSMPLDTASESSVDKSPTSISPGLRSIPVLPSRAAPAPPSLTPPPPIPPKIALPQASVKDGMPHPKPDLSFQRSMPPIPSSLPSETDTVPYSRSNENLQRAPSDPIPPPFVRRRRPVPSSSRTKILENTSKAVSTSTPLSTDTTHHASTPDPTEQSRNASQEQRPPSDAHSSARPRSSYELKQSIQHAASNATTTDKYPIPTTPSDPPPIPDVPQKSPLQAAHTKSPPCPHPHTDIRSSFSNASATDRYPISVSLDNLPHVPATSTQSLPTVTPYTGTQDDVRHAKSNASATDKYPIAVSPTSPPPVPSLLQESLPTNITSSAPSKSDTSLALSPSRPMTALAKRRAAHAKRMQMAFGPDSENT